MKKQLYITPTTDVVRVETIKMLADSLKMNTSQEAQEVTEVEDLLSRRNFSIWSDDEEE